jgi:hypothetical protein
VFWIHPIELIWLIIIVDNTFPGMRSVHPASLAVPR